MAKSLLKPGVRVVRGPDWNCRKQDSGEGHLGTIVFVPKQGSADNKVTVIWDSGRELRYRAGQDGKYDLRVFDSAQIGIVHNGIMCDSCDSTPIVGMRWKCSTCVDFDLCTPCYMQGKHDTSHSFLRIDVENASAWAVPPRNKSRTTDAKGIFKGSKVMRGPHWKWKNQDGGEGKEGVVSKIDVWNKTSFRGCAVVTWNSNKETHRYRLGGEGSVDLVFTRTKDTGSAGKYYVEHLPLCDVVNPGIVQLRPSDKVSVQLNEEAFKQLQDESYGWNENMSQCTKEIGTIIQMIHGGSAAKVQYEDSNTWTLKRIALNRKHTFAKDETVQVLNDYNSVQELQQGHGGWNDQMKKILGKCGRIMKIEADGDILLRVDNSTWVLNPVCINVATEEDCKNYTSTPAEDSDTECSSSDDSYLDSDSDDELGETLTDVADAIAKLFVDMLRAQPGEQSMGETKAEPPINIVKAAANGDIESVKKFVTRYPDKVDKTQEGKTGLQLACYEGHTEIVEFLLNNKDKINWKDSEGDTPLHYAVHGEEVDSIKCLIKHKAEINVINAKEDTPLHIAVNKGSQDCTLLLIKHGADVNIKDKDGDTSMHDAVQKKEGQPHIMQLVLKAKGADHSIANAKGFNVLQWATIKNKIEAVDIILGINKDIMNEQMKDEKATALHLAAINNHIEIVTCLLKTAGIKIDVGDKSKQTALHLAIIQGHKQVVELLLAAKCDINVTDEKKNSPLHLALSKQSLPKQVKELMGVRKSDTDVNIQIICLLLENKADVNIKNDDGMTPLDLVGDNELLKEFMKRTAHKARHSQFAKTKSGYHLPMHWDPMGPERLKRVKLSKDDGGMAKMEYDVVSKKFHHTLRQARIISVERVQNVFLWELFCMMKRNMIRASETEVKYGLGNANEMDLFHGTTPKWIDTIAKDNLDFRLAGERVGAIFGLGAYFAVDAKYSDLYADFDDKKHKFMIVAKVLVGKYCEGKGGIVRPPNIDPKDEMSPLFQSCVDDVKNPKVYCLFDKNQYYPEYIIEYQ